jgi:hypothetical protein
MPRSFAAAAVLRIRVDAQMTMPPVLRRDTLTLTQLTRMAQEFDGISAQVGETYPAVEFVRWLRDERVSSAFAYDDPRPDEAA